MIAGRGKSGGYGYEVEAALQVGCNRPIDARLFKDLDKVEDSSEVSVEADASKASAEELTLRANVEEEDVLFSLKASADEELNKASVE